MSVKSSYPLHRGGREGGNTTGIRETPNEKGGGGERDREREREV